MKGFWSLTLYDEHHFFAPNEIKRYSLGTKNKDLQVERGRLTRALRAVRATAGPAQRANWLPAPKGADFLALPARLLASDRDHRRHLDATAGRSSGVARPHWIHLCHPSQRFPSG